jgi:hypothetical protein
MSRCDHATAKLAPPAAQASGAAAASRRLDDAFRGYLAERGSKPIALAQVTALVNGVSGLRLAGDAVLDLWQRDDAADGDRSAAREALLGAAARIEDWYTAFAAGLSGRATVPTPLDHDARADERLLDAVTRDLRRKDGRASATAARMIWTADHLDGARRLQRELTGPAHEVYGQRVRATAPSLSIRRLWPITEG